MSTDRIAEGFARWAEATDSAMIAVTAAHDGELDASLVGFHSQAGIEPPRYIVWLSVKNHTTAIAQRCDVLGVHLLGAGQHDLAHQLGAITADEDAHKLDGVSRRRHVSGAVLLDDCAAWFVGQVVERFDGGDHTGVLLAPLDVAGGDPPEPLRLTDIDFTAGHPAD